MKRCRLKRSVRSVAAVLGVCGVMVGCKTPVDGPYSPHWELKSSVASSEVPVGVSLDRVDDAPLPGLDGTGPSGTSESGSVSPTDGAPPLPGNWSLHGGLDERSIQSAAPGTQHPAEPPMPDGAKSAGVSHETLLAADALPPLPAAPAEKVKSTPSKAKAAPLHIAGIPLPERRQPETSGHPDPGGQDPVLGPIPSVQKSEPQPARNRTASAPAASAAAAVVPATAEAKTDLAEILLLAKKVETRSRKAKTAKR